MVILYLQYEYDYRYLSLVERTPGYSEYSYSGIKQYGAYCSYIPMQKDEPARQARQQRKANHTTVVGGCLPIRYTR